MRDTARGTVPTALKTDGATSRSGGWPRGAEGHAGQQPARRWEPPSGDPGNRDSPTTRLRPEVDSSRGPRVRSQRGRVLRPDNGPRARKPGELPLTAADLQSQGTVSGYPKCVAIRLWSEAATQTCTFIGVWQPLRGQRRRAGVAIPASRTRGASPETSALRSARARASQAPRDSSRATLNHARRPAGVHRDPPTPSPRPWLSRVNPSVPRGPVTAGAVRSHRLTHAETPAIYRPQLWYVKKASVTSWL